MIIDHFTFVSDSVEELFALATATLCLEGDVTDSIFFTENFFYLGINLLNLAKGLVLTVEVGREDDVVFINHPGVDVVDSIDAVNACQVLGNRLVV